MSDLTRPTLTVLHRTLPVQCPACRDHLGRGPAVKLCPACGTPHHEACLAELGCSSLQCATPTGSAGDGPDPFEQFEHDGQTYYILSGTRFSDLDAREMSYIQVGSGIMDPYRFVSSSYIGDALDDVAAWLEDHAPGLLAEPEYPDDVDVRGVCAQCRADLGDDAPEPCQHVEKAEECLISCDGGLWISSEDVGSVELSGELLRALKVHLLEAELNEEWGHILDWLGRVRADAQEVWECRCDAPANEFEDEHDDECMAQSGIDARLQVTVSPHGHYMSYQTHSGDSSYDQDHRGYWGEACISAHDSREELEVIAEALIYGAVNSYAESLS